MVGVSSRRSSEPPSWLARPLAPVRSLGEALRHAHPYQVGEIHSGGARLYYEIHGTGPRLVVLTHGILLDSRMNRRLAGDLAERGFRVALLDLPGHGQSDKPRHASAHRMDSYARHVIALLDALGAEQAVVGGVSLGANVALHVAVLAPERVRALVVEMPVLEWAAPGAGLVFLPLLLGVHYAAPVVRQVARLARHIPDTGIGTLDAVLGSLRLEPEEAAAVLHGMIVGPITPTYEERRAVTAPTLVIGHKVDFVHPFTDAERLTHQLPNARLLQAHSILELRTTPARLTEQIAEFLSDAFGPWRLRRSALSPNDGVAGHG
jgi:pimeloyl-ACP methyl ester carboxylesterase